MAKAAKVPVIMQLEALECGAACLCMIAAYYKKWIPLTQVRADCGVSRDGSVAKNMLDAGRTYGFKATGYKIEPSAAKELKLPAIIHWDFNHFVVLCGVNEKKKKVYLNDPARGRITVDWEEFDRAFTGIILTFEPDKHFKPEGKQKSVISFVKRCLKGALFPFVLVFILSLVGQITGIINQISNRIFIDYLMPHKHPEWLVPFLGLIIALMVVDVLVGIITNVYWLKIRGKFDVTASSTFMWHVLRLPLDFFSQRYVGDIVARQNSTANIAITFINQVAPLFIRIISMVLYFFLMMQYSWQLTLIGIASMAVDFLFVRYISERMLNFQRAAAPNLGKLSSATYAGFTMIETIKSTGAENGYFERWAGFLTKQNNANVAVAKFATYFGLIPSTIKGLANIFMQLMGIYLILNGQFTIGMLQVFGGFLGGFLGPVNDLMSLYQTYIGMRISMERIEDVLDYPTDVPDDNEINDKSEEKLEGILEIKDITFGYSKLAKPLLTDFSISMKPGSWVALVGASGSGKSTVAKLIMGLYQPWKGEILFDGKPREKIDPYRFRTSVAMVDQDKIMFHDTIKNNIKMWDDSIEDFAVVMASKDADVHDTIMERPEGYDHVLSEGGKDFSGGQIQRFEIARTLSQEPTVVILDEATSALDAKTEEKVMKNIRRMGCTCVVVAHRLSTVRDCDEILVLDKGKVVERGKHDELMALGGKYKELIITE